MQLSGRRSLRNLAFVTVVIFSIIPILCGSSVFADNTITLESGAIYTGSLWEGIPHGHGEVYWPDDSVYSGEFNMGFMHGNGILAFGNGDKYEGAFEYGYRSGKGIMSYANGDTYNGDWFLDKMHGNGKYTFHTPDPAFPKKNDVYSGGWSLNMMHGKGQYTFANGKSQSGYWVHNEYRGSKLTDEIKRAIGEP